jgi:hypothetical protein
MANYSNRLATDTTIVVAPLPFLVEGAFSLNVLRTLRGKGADVAVAFRADGSGGYTPGWRTSASTRRRMDTCFRVLLYPVRPRSKIELLTTR